MVKTVKVKDYTPQDGRRLLKKLRPVDALEWRAGLDEEPSLEGLNRMARKSSNVRAAYFKGKLVAVYGLFRQTLLDDDGYPWMLGTTEMERKPVQRAFIIHSKRELRDIIGSCTRLSNVVAEENVLAIRWLEAVGFELRRHSKREQNGVTFIPFIMENPACVLCPPSPVSQSSEPHLAQSAPPSAQSQASSVL